MIFRFVVAVVLCVTSAVCIPAQELVRSDFDNASNEFGVPSTFSDGFSFSGVVDIGNDSARDRVFTAFTFAGGTSRNGVPNAGDIALHQFVLARVVDTKNFRVEDFRAAYETGNNYEFVDNVITFDKPTNANYDIPYDTTGPFHLYRLEFNGLDIQVEKGKTAAFFLLGDSTVGAGGDFELAFSTSNDHLDYFDADFDPRSLVTNEEFPLPFNEYAVDAYATTTSLLGDVNLDGSVDLLDVAPFVALLTNGDFQVEADINRDGVVNLLDVGPFVDLLSGA